MRRVVHFFVFVPIFALAFAGTAARAEEAAAPAAEQPAAPAKKAVKKKKNKKSTKRTKGPATAKKSKRVRNVPQEDIEIGRAWLAAHPEFAPKSGPAALAPAAPAPAQTLTLPAPPPRIVTLPLPAPAAPAAVAAPAATEPGSGLKTSEPVAEQGAGLKGVPATTTQQGAPAAAPASARAAQPFSSNYRDLRVVPPQFGPNSIYRINLPVDAGVILASAATSGVIFAYRHSLITARGLGNPADLNRLDQSVVGNYNPSLATASNVTTLAALALPVMIDLADVGWSRELFEDGVVMSEVLSMTSLGVTAAKYTTQRRSPLLYSPANASMASSSALYRSFVSWQTATTFASLSALSFTLTQRHEYGALSWIGTALIGGSVAAERVISGTAFYTDVVAGAAIGIAAGTIIPWLHLNTRYNWSVAPTPNGVQIGGSGRF